MKNPLLRLDNFLPYKFDKLIYHIRPVNLHDTSHLRCVVSVTNQNNYSHIDNIDLFRTNARESFASRAASRVESSSELIENDLSQLIEKLEDKRRQLEEQPAPVEIPPLQREEAVKRLEDPHFIESIVPDYEKSGYVGEAVNLLTGYLVATSRKLSQPLSMIISSRSGAGKSWLLNGILNFMPPEDYFKHTSLTDKTLYYKDKNELKHKTIALEEKEGAQKAEYSIKNLLSSGGLSISTVTKNSQSGKMKSEIYKVEGPTNCLSTTTASTEADYETMTRFILATVNETPEQTARILEQQRKARTLAGIIQRRNSSGIFLVHHNIQRLLRPLEIVNPLAEKLTFPSDRLIMRRGHQHYLRLIDVIAFLHQYQRPIKKAKDELGEFEYIEVTQKDIDLADMIKDKVLSRTLDDLVPPARNLLRLLEELVQKKRNQNGGSDLLTRKEIREFTGWNHYQIEVHLKQLIDLEYVTVVSGKNGIKYQYKLLHYSGGNGDQPNSLDLKTSRYLTEPCETVRKLVTV